MNTATIEIPARNARRKVLLLSSSDPGTGLLQEILARHTDLASAGDIPGMLSLLAADAYEALFCDWRFAMGTWRDVVEGVQSQYPELPVIVVCRTGGEQEWREVLDAGAFDLLTAPYCERTVLMMLEHAMASRDRNVLFLLSVMGTVA